VLATVVRYFGGIKLGAGGLVRAYTDSVAQALLAAQKMPIIRQRHLACSAPYPLEGLIRRELDGAGATLDAVEHADAVRFGFHLPDGRADLLVARLNESGNGRIAWLQVDEDRSAAEPVALSGNRIPDITTGKRTRPRRTAIMAGSLTVVLERIHSRRHRQYTAKNNT
jgi:hypothetical protein